MERQLSLRSHSMRGASCSAPTAVSKHILRSASVDRSAPSPIGFRKLIKGLGLEFEASPSSWRKAVDYTAETLVFFQLDLRGSKPGISKSILLRPEPCIASNVEMLVPFVFMEDSLLALPSSHVRKAMGRTYLQDSTDLMKLLEYVGALDVYDERVSESEEEAVPQPVAKRNDGSGSRSFRGRSGTPYPSSRTRQMTTSDIRDRSEIPAVVTLCDSDEDELPEMELHNGLPPAPDDFSLDGPVISDDQRSVQSVEMSGELSGRKSTAVSTCRAQSGKYPRREILQVAHSKPGPGVSTCRLDFRTRGSNSRDRQRESVAADSSSSRYVIHTRQKVSPLPSKRQRSANSSRPTKRTKGNSKGDGRRYWVWDPRQGMAALQQEGLRTHIKNAAVNGYRCWEFPCCGALQFGGDSTSVYRHIHGLEKNGARGQVRNVCKRYREEKPTRRRYLLGYPPAGEIRTFHLVDAEIIDVNVRTQEQVYARDGTRSMYIAKEDAAEAATLADRVEALQADGRLSGEASIDEVLQCLAAQDHAAAEQS